MTAATAVARAPLSAFHMAPLHWLRGTMLWLVALQHRHRERLQLAAMDDDALKDIGLSRCDVMAELAKPRWRR